MRYVIRMLWAVVVVEVVGLLCEKKPDTPNTLTNEIYDTVKIVNQTWMKKNLNIKMDSSWCYDNHTDSCAKYGRLYSWDAAMEACQSIGWSLPDTTDWNILMNAVGGFKVEFYWKDVGNKLKSKNGWDSDGNGTDEYSFSAVSGGMRDNNGFFSGVGGYGQWWTATKTGYVYYFRAMSHDHDDVLDAYVDEGYGFSVRCVKKD